MTGPRPGPLLTTVTAADPRPPLIPGVFGGGVFGAGVFGRRR